MIKATVLECCTAWRALQRINETKLGAKAAWRMSRIIGKLKSVVLDFETTQSKIFLELGAVPAPNNNLVINEPVRGDQTDEEWQVVTEKHKAVLKELNDKMKELNEQSVDVDYDPIQIDLLENAKVSANDLVDAGPFLTE